MSGEKWLVVCDLDKPVDGLDVLRVETICRSEDDAKRKANECNAMEWRPGRRYRAVKEGGPYR